MPRWAKIAIAVVAVVVIGGYAVSVYQLHHPDCPPATQLSRDLAQAQGQRVIKIEQCYAHYSLNPPIGSTPQSSHF
jgi:hypothetical protein